MTNTGDVPLADVVVTDPLAPNCDRTIGPLAPGQSVTYECTVSELPNQQFTNVAGASGTGPDQQTVTAQDDATVGAVSAETLPATGLDSGGLGALGVGIGLVGIGLLAAAWITGRWTRED